jgi:DNA-binding transcriptional ArsR family regulator
MLHLRWAGARGVDANELSSKLGLPRSIVYSTLKELYRLGYIFTYPRERRNRGERRKRYVCERGTWGKYGIDKEFDNALTLEGELEVFRNTLGPTMLDLFRGVYEDFAQKKRLQKFLPLAVETNICPKCSLSHEAMEFFYAIILRAVDSFILESAEFRKFLEEHGYARQQYDLA